MKCARCANTNPLYWDDVSDAQTGTMYARCQRCGTHQLASPKGFVDWHVGFLLDSHAVMGSAWTQQISAMLLSDLSKLTTKNS